MNFKTTYILFGVLGAMLVVLGVVLWVGPTPAPVTGYLFPAAHEKDAEITPDKIDTVVIERHRPEGKKIVFVREGEGKDRPWRLKEPINVPVDRYAVDTLVREVLDARKDEKAELNKNLKQWGLDNPRRVITLEGQGKTFRLSLGDTAGAGVKSEVVYVLSSAFPKTPMAVLLSELETTDRHELDQFRSRTLLAESDSDIGYLSVRRGKGEPVVLESASGQWRFVKPAYGPADPEGAAGAPPDKAPTGVRQILTALAGIKIESKPEPPGEKPSKSKPKKDTGFVEDNASAKSLKKYGLESEKTAELVLSVKRSPSAKKETTLLIGKKADSKGEQYYARLAGDRNVVKVAGKGLEPIRKFLDSPEEVRDHNLVRLPEKPDVVRIEYRGGEKIELIRQSMPTPSRGPHGFGGLPALWKLYLNKDQNGLTTDPAAVNKLIDLLLGNRQVREFPSGKSDKQLGLDSPDVVVSLWVNGVKGVKQKDDKKDKKKDKKKDASKSGDRPELKKAVPDVELAFGAVGSDKLVAVRRRSGKGLKTVSVVKVPEDLLIQARENPLNYLQKDLPPLVSAAVLLPSVRKIALTLDGKTTVIARKNVKDPSSPWLFAEPSDLKGRKADKDQVPDLYNNLNKPAILGWQKLKPSSEDLANWGLKSARNRGTITYTSDGKTREASLLIGKPTPDKKGYYAKQKGLDPVFILGKDEIEKLKAPLLDLSVFTFSAGNVKTMKLNGKPHLGQPNVLQMERKSATSWLSKKPAGLKINAARAESLVARLEFLKAEKFLETKGVKSSYGLDVKKGALEIEIVLVSKEKLTLTVGKISGKSFYAISNKHPGTVFLIAKTPDDVLEQVKKSLEFLQAE